jgi:hypothetical protein
VLTGTFRFDPKSHRYWIEQPDGSKWVVPGMSEIELVSGRLNDRWFTQHGRDRGSVVHQLTCDLELGQRTLDDIEGELRPWVLAYAQFVADERPRWTMLEQTVVNRELGCATTIDRFGWLKGGWATLNIKTGGKHRTHSVVRAGEVLTQFGYRAPVQRFTLRIMPSGGYVLDAHESDHDFTLFLNDLETWRKECHDPQRHGPLEKLLRLDNARSFLRRRRPWAPLLPRSPKP